MPDSSNAIRRTRLTAWTVMFCCWLVQGLSARHSLDADGVSYLNIVDSCLHGNWHALVNGYWSPGYPFLLTLWFKAFHPSPYYVPLAVRMFGVFSLVIALLSFEYFLKAFLRFRASYLIGESDPGNFLSNDSLRLVGYALFLWISVFLTPARLDQPDIWIFSLYLLASALCIQLIFSSEKMSLRFALLGLLLGLAYLVKAVMFPLSFTFFAGLLFYKKTWRALPKLALAVTVFTAVALPFLTSLSHDKGRITYGDVGPINYRHITGEDDAQLPESGLPAAPHVQEFTKIMGLGTYPPWADPSHAYHGEPVRFALRKQLNRIHVVWRYYFDLYVVELGCLFCGFLTLLFASNLHRFPQLFFRQIALWFPAVCGFALYGLARVDGRFLAGFTIALFAAAIAAISFEDGSANKIGKSVAATVTILLVAQVVVVVGHEAIKLPGASPYPDWQLVQTMEGIGVKSGDRVSYMGDALSYHVWAYLGHFSLIGEIPEADVSTFWASTREQKQQVLVWLAHAGAKALVTKDAPPPALSLGWLKVPDSDFFVLLLPSEP